MRYASVRPRFEPFLLAVERPGRYLGLERNVVRRDLAASDVVDAIRKNNVLESAGMVVLGSTGEAILLSEVPVIPLVWMIEADPMTDRLRGYRPSPTITAGDTWNVQRWWLAAPSSS